MWQYDAEFLVDWEKMWKDFDELDDHSNVIYQDSSAGERNGFKGIIRRFVK